MEQRGKIYLLGVGPGDPGLLTVRALEVLRKCTLAVYDEQIPRPILDRLPEMTERAVVTITEQRDADDRLRVNESLAAQLKQGAKVARLYLGDPFLMGFGGEDALYFRSVGLDVEILPGVSLAMASPSLSGIPIMQRGIFKSVFFTAGPYLGNSPVTGPIGPPQPVEEEQPKSASGEESKPTRAGLQIRRRRKNPIPWGGVTTSTQTEAEKMTPGDLAWWKAIAESADTLLLAEAHAHLAVIQRGLLQGGRAASEPVALIIGASRPSHQVIISSIGEMVTDLSIPPTADPALLVVGDVVNLRSHIGFHDLEILRGYRIALLDPAGSGFDLVSPLEQSGMLVSRFQIIKRTPAQGLVDGLVEIRRDLRRLSTLVFRGPREIDGFFQALGSGGLDPHTISGNCRILMFETSSEDVLRRWGHTGSVVAEKFAAALLKRHFKEEKRTEQIVLAGEPTDFNALAKWLRPRSQSVSVFPIFEEAPSPTDLVSLKEMIQSGDLDALILTSGREVEMLEEAWGEEEFAYLMDQVTLFSACQEAAAALRMRYIDEFKEAESVRTDAVLHAISTHLTHEKGTEAK
ncbi:MAG: hypothetical protein JJU11_18070 [Candidatus Sumerlaeia bacterium]|nr:hypothetical protein [Candidatus Sumerlaeia bacterium]